MQNEHNRKIDKNHRYANVKNQADTQSINVISPFSTWKFKRCSFHVSPATVEFDETSLLPEGMNLKKPKQPNCKLMKEY